VRFVSEFPLTVTGKVQKYMMREQMCAELNTKAERTA
jgi:fatty-acyl-CoA synthase